MQNFINTADNTQWAFEDHVGVTDTDGVYSFTDANGNPLTVPTTLVPGTLPPVPPSPADLAAAAYMAAIAAGLVVTSTGTPALNGTYSVSAATRPDGGNDQADISIEAQFISAFGEFTNETTTSLVWSMMNGAPAAFTSMPQFLAFAKAAGRYVAACKVAAKLQAAGQPFTYPSNAVTIL